jgi:hypothetical protein
VGWSWGRIMLGDLRDVMVLYCLVIVEVVGYCFHAHHLIPLLLQQSMNINPLNRIERLEMMEKSVISHFDVFLIQAKTITYWLASSASTQYIVFIFSRRQKAAITFVMSVYLSFYTEQLLISDLTMIAFVTNSLLFLFISEHPMHVTYMWENVR